MTRAGSDGTANSISAAPNMKHCTPPNLEYSSRIGIYTFPGSFSTAQSRQCALPVSRPAETISGISQRSCSRRVDSTSAWRGLDNLCKGSQAQVRDQSTFIKDLWHLGGMICYSPVRTINTISDWYLADLAGFYIAAQVPGPCLVCFEKLQQQNKSPIHVPGAGTSSTAHSPPAIKASKTKRLPLLNNCALKGIPTLQASATGQDSSNKSSTTGSQNCPQARLRSHKGLPILRPLGLTK